MNDGAWQLALVIAGGIVALASSLVTTWLTSRLSDRKRLKEKRERIHEMHGTRRALLRDSDDTDEAFENWFKLCASDPAKVSFMLGYIEKGNSQIESLNERFESAKEVTGNLISERAELAEKIATLEAKKKLLNQEHARLLLVHAELASRAKYVEQTIVVQDEKTSGNEPS